MVETVFNVPYGNEPEQITDVYLPDGPATGAVIDIHGGGWFRGDKLKDADLGEIFAEQGYVTFVANYRIGERGHYPKPLEDMDLLYEWLKKSDYDFPREHIAVFGSSVGGNMAGEMAIKYGIPAVSLSGIFDIANWLNSHQDVKGSMDHIDNFGGASADINQDGADDPFYKGFVEGYFGGRTDQFEEATPAPRVTDKTGTMYIGNSLNEFVPNSGVLDMAKALSDHNVPFTVRFVTGTRHAKGYWPKVQDDVLAFLKRNI
ncbi:alpha/beta hydrolase [Lacticaseibacillus pabuli]|uniref:Alpha/beta hydrolase n=1 Tax=Lacticaseibacillus pabuli TaxID=3025672 RepID=A0ABY7WRL7_9LACO|nr:alpha/beta hydrolase [Lacticaseibacillus sp. KACC 23028]WDF82829.1 alpha/beta hydrolase [Lacticaseibacillus sp. KACC 23028]